MKLEFPQHSQTRVTLGFRFTAATPVVQILAALRTETAAVLRTECGKRQPEDQEFFGEVGALDLLVLIMAIMEIFIRPYPAGGRFENEIKRDPDMLSRLLGAA
jgi:hypothetical protein